MNERYWEIDKSLKQYNDLFLDQNKVSIYNYLTTYNVLYDDLIDSNTDEIIDELLTRYKDSEFKCDLKDYLIITNGEIKVNGVKLYINSSKKDIFLVVDTILKYIVRKYFKETYRY